MALTNYVKFVRGTTAAFQKKINEGTVDKDTLYFVYPSKDSLTGQLYLGMKSLSDGTASDVSSSSIGDLKDILLTEVGDRQLLIYDSETEKWVNTSIENAIGSMVGADANVDGDKGLVPAPQAGDQNKVLKGNGKWEDEFISSLDEQNFQVIDGKLNLAEDKFLLTPDQVKKINDLVIDEDGKVAISGTVSASNVDGLQDLLDQKVNQSDYEDLNTKVESLDELLNGKIDEENGTVVEGLNTKVQALEDIIKGVVNEETGENNPGLQEQLNNINDILNGKPETEDGEKVEGLVDKVDNISTTVGNLNDLFDYREESEKEDTTSSITVIQAINNLYERLIWGELDEFNIYDGRQAVEIAEGASVADAINELNSNQVLVLNGDEVVTDNLTIGSGIAIDANGAEFTGEVKIAKDAIIQNAKFTGNVIIQ